MNIKWLKNSIFGTLSAFLLLGTVGAANIVEFNFNNGTKTGAITNNTTFISNAYTADNGIVGNINTSIISLVGGSTFDSWAQGADLILAASPSSINRNTGANVKYWMINFSTIGHGNLILSSKQRSSNTGPRDFKVQYSTGGAIWTDVPSSSITVANNFTSGVLSGVSLPSELNNQSNVYLRWIMTSNTSVNSSLVAAGGTQRIDDIVVEGIEIYNLNYTGGNNGIISGNSIQTVFSGTNGSSVTAIANTGYSFVNRSDGSTANPRTDINVTGNISVTANFAINQYLVTFQDYNSTVLSTGLVNHGSSATPPSNPIRTGYTFSGWNTNFSNITGPTTITAQYSINQYLVTFQDYNSTVLSTGLVNHGSSATPPSNPIRTGYTFSGWNTNFSNITGPTTITAQYSINQYLVTFQDYNSTVLSTGLVNHGSSATPPSNPIRTGYTFSGWNTNFSNITGPTTITAQYSINQYTITFNTNSGTPISPISGNYNTAIVTPNNPTRTGYTFNGWNPNIPTTIPAQNITVTAQWIENTSPTISTGTSSGGGGGNSLTKDKCPNGDYTDSYYDNACGTASTITNTGSIGFTGMIVSYPSQQIYNDTITNGYCYTNKSNVSIIDSSNITTTDEFKKSLTFLYSYDMTMFNQVDDFDPYRTLTREEAAKIFSNFAMNVLCRKPNKNLTIEYTDLNQANPTLQSYITTAYQLGLMKGGNDNTFRPNDTITKAELNAVLIRMILKSYLPEDTTDTWYSEYNSVASDLSIIKYGAGNDPVIRNDASLMLFRAYKNQLFSLQHIDYESFVLQNRDQFIQ